MCNDSTFEKLLALLRRVSEHSEFYKQKYHREGFDIREIQTPEDIAKIPLTTKNELRDAYPLGLQAVPEEEIVRIHSSSGTTGLPIIMPYTKKDVEDWAIQFERCYRMAGVTDLDRIQITPGYGLWTAGIGFQAGAERLGAMVVPMGPGNTPKQIQMMQDLKTTVLASTSSYALLLAEEIMSKGLRDTIHLKKGIIGSERWGDKMRARIQQELGIELYDIYGLTEAYGPGISISCQYDQGMHYWDDYLYFEIIDSATGQVLPEGELGELVITTLVKEGSPLIRYRTHDITRLIPGPCPCGSPYPRHDRIVGRTDDMVKVKGVNIFPGQIDSLLSSLPGASSEYQVHIDHFNGKDRLRLRFEKEPEVDAKTLEDTVVRSFKNRIGITIAAEAVEIGVLPRSEKKSKRIFDERYA
ncbi:phenylacetate--CoA ligase family protein [Bianquea renquensis]|uniref:Phenylacetate-coenzyme A ligase n=1 Tax=Bianquea renquensis TaxID=2763661 RepID=A0A926DRL3_9FIRM|nr:phenylacetate--CoA ligase [Bianquea renquensis]MBC8542532.1 phenylacetate--CoA ligase [Bianquea renquensis]